MTAPIDPITLSVIRGQLQQLANEMDTTVINSAFSAIITEANDIGNGLYRPDGRTIIQGETGIPIFCGNMRFTVESVKEAFEGNINPGDIFITNEPYLGGTHLMDVKVIKPVFVEGELEAFLANTGHWSDIGGIVPGGFNGQTEEIYQEGIQIKPVKIHKEGTPNEDVRELLFNNVRYENDIRGDFKAQLNALDVGQRRFKEIVEEHGAETVLTAFDELERSSEKKMRARIDSLDDGIYEFTDYLDNDGVVDEPIPITVELTIDGSSVTLDFTKTEAPPCQGPFNIPRSSTITGGNIAFKHVYPDIPINAGCFEPLNFVIPEDSILNAKKPSPTVGFTETVQRIEDVVNGALSKASEDVPANSFSTSFVVTVAQRGGGGVMQGLISGGYGGSKTQDGLSHSTPPYARARMADVEILEDRHPVRFHKKLLRAESEGPGEHRGGFGTTYDIEVLEDSTVSFVGDRVVYPPRGVRGGEDAATAKLRLIRDGEETVPLFKSKGQDEELAANDRLFIQSPGGGGYGPPTNRDPEKVLTDVQMGYMTQEHAEEHYGVDIEQLQDESASEEG